MAEYHKVRHYLHVIMTSSTAQRLDEVGDVLGVKPITRVLDAVERLRRAALLLRR